MSEQIKDGGPAFPCFKPEGPLMQDGGPEWSAEVIPGMTLRDYFAAKAMQALIVDGIKRDGSATISNVARDAYRMSDAMLAAREAKS